MFPNVRLLVGALFASVVALSCGFGLFAAFRVNHEPLSRLPVGTSPVQFVANEVAGRAGWGTPFDGQSRLNGPQRGEIAADASAVTPAGQASVEFGEHGHRGGNQAGRGRYTRDRNGGAKRNRAACRGH